MDEEYRNVWVVFDSEPDAIKGGLWAADTMTNAQFLNTAQIAFRSPGGFVARKRGSDAAIEANDRILEHGYYILSPTIPGCTVEVSNERYYPRTLSLSSTSRDSTFTHDVRQRDGRCVISGDVNMDAGRNAWVGFQAAHVFPLALSDIFASHGFLGTISDSRGVNSPNNGLLLRSDIHQLWDGYYLAVNPDDNYRVYTFKQTFCRYHNAVLDPVCRRPVDPHRVFDSLLRWHFEQAVLFNMCGAGEPSFDFDFPAGRDMMGAIREGPLPARRMEAELFGRLYSYRESEQSAR
ncbi:hypothetical protein FQN49_007167 [Arthroderma sp. PD_2]|nr:hypothetical protein FQN49_007167 [Arthroderma sp. PD_2]